MKTFLSIIFILFLNYSFSQLISGEIVDDGRVLLTQTNFKLKGANSGVVVFDISVDINGKVTSAVVIPSLTTIKSTPLKMDAKNLVNTFKFQPGTAYPKFHHAKVKISFEE